MARRRLLVIGIGAGDPDQVTVQAVKAMNGVDRFFIPRKGDDKAELADIRHEILRRHVANSDDRIVAFDYPVRRAAEDGPAYRSAVADWHEAIAAAYRRLLLTELDEGETGAFLVWGDPAIYDSTLRILERVLTPGDIELDYEVIPAVSALQVLTARHKVALCDIGKSTLVASGRALADGLPNGIDSAAIMLDLRQALQHAGDDATIFWGARLGMADEVLVSGRLGDVLGEIEQRREDIRRRHGWIMETALVKR